MTTNHQVRLAARPVGNPKRSDWNFTEETVGDPGPGGSRTGRHRPRARHVAGGA